MKVQRLDTTDRTQLAAARSIVRLLLPTEDVIDRSIVAGAALIQQIAQSRIDLDLPVSSGHDAMIAAGESMGAMLEARDRMVECHRRLVDVRDTLGLEGSDVGCVPSSAGSRQPAPAMRAA